MLQSVLLRILLVLACLGFSPLLSIADGMGDADVVKVKAVNRGASGWTFHVTVSHPDTGWEDYADGWDVMTEDGIVLTTNEGDQFTRLLFHPHVGEQPFTRSQGGIVMPEGLSVVIVRAHDLVDGFGGKEVRVDLNTIAGPNYTVNQ